MCFPSILLLRYAWWCPTGLASADGLRASESAGTFLGAAAAAVPYKLQSCVDPLALSCNTLSGLEIAASAWIQAWQTICWPVIVIVRACNIALMDAASWTSRALQPTCHKLCRPVLPGRSTASSQVWRMLYIS